MNPTQLAARLNGLGYSARHRQLLEIAREPEVEGLIDTLAMGDAHQASLALTLADHADRPQVPVTVFRFKLLASLQTTSRIKMLKVSFLYQIC